MPGPYSYDLRSRVIAAVEKGMAVSEASQTFGVHRDTIVAWLARKAATGDVAGESGLSAGPLAQDS